MRTTNKLWAVWVLAFAACQTSEPTLLLHVGFDGSLGVRQLAFTATVDGETRGQHKRPETEAEVLADGQSVRLHFQTADVGRHARIDIEGLAQGQVVGTASAELDISAGETELVARVESLACEPACGPGLACVAGTCQCTAESCPDGCCANGVCEGNSLNRCGNQGQTCSVCPVGKADICQGGSCQCGPGAVCGVGQECMLGTCRCTSLSCPDGCCEGDVCKPGDTTAACGTSGQHCSQCPSAEPCAQGVCSGCKLSCASGCCSGSSCVAPSGNACAIDGNTCVACNAQSDSCSALGECSCGSGPPCAPGQRCNAGLCLCDSTSCPSGCCAGASCVSSSLNQCGSGGEMCNACDPAVSDSCTAGKCKCGGSAACNNGRRCVAGNCVCDATSCPNGCCVGAVCNVAVTSACGVGGGPCMSCEPLLADRCTAGGCKCGTGGLCNLGQHCVAGGCVCDSASCGSGCCTGTTCNAKSTATCGNNGLACNACTAPSADSCSSTGTCRCGTAAGPCGSGQVCLAGVCRCNASSCPTGCCESDVCQPGNTKNQCGNGGAACAKCNGSHMCVGQMCN